MSHDGKPGPKGIVIAATSSGVGKTVTTMGLIAALRGRGLTIAPAKCGPDYIDPKFLELAAAKSCVNLDPWAMQPGQVRARAVEHAYGNDFIVVEGVMGLFDGAAGGGGSTADLANILDLPVVLVVDASRQAQSIAAVVHGFVTLRDKPTVCGVIATRIASDRHEAMIAAALGELDVPLLGAVRASEDLKIGSRHLGLVQASEQANCHALVDAAAEAVRAHVDMDRLVALGRQLPSPAEQPARMPPLGQRIAVATDVAFGFAYPHLLDDWRQQGAELLPFSPLADEGPDAVADAVFLPGGYPELFAGPIAAAARFRDGMEAARARRSIIYGECGGYMVLGDGLIDADDVAHPMLGFLSHATSFAERKRQLGYRRLETIADVLLPKQLAGHEFHYSTIAEGGRDRHLFNARDSAGAALGPAGGWRENVMGSYIHLVDQAV